MMAGQNIFSPRSTCDFSCTDHMCVTLDRAGVPRDNRWRSLVLYLRSLEHHAYLTTEQKTRFQSLLLHLVQGRDYSAAQFQQLMVKSEEIFSAPYVEKIQNAVDESERMLLEFQTLLRKRRGEIKNIELHSSSAIENGKTPLEVLHILRLAMRDVITVMDEDLKSLDQVSKTDVLTGLANRRAFDQALQETIAKAAASGKPSSLILLDIDHFKKFNDTYGHCCGDQVLVNCAAIIKECADKYREKTDRHSLTARFGGEEFVILVPEMDAVSTGKLAETMRQRLANHRFLLRSATGEIVEKEITVTASFGVADRAMTHSGVVAEELIELADKALYLAKAAGRNQVRIFSKS